MLRGWLHAILWRWRHWRGVYAVEDAERLCAVLPSNVVAVDVGAHAGSWLVPLARRLRDGRVIGIEALPYYEATLQKLSRLFRWRNVTLINAAVTREPQSVRMVWRDPEGRRLTGLTHVAASAEGTEGTVEVSGKPLDELLQGVTGRVALIKVDVEGAELGVFEGGVRTIDRDRPMVYSEISAANLKRYGHRPEDVLTFFASRNYRQYVFGEGGRLQTFADLAVTGRSDVLFVPSERLEDLKRSGAFEGRA